MARVIPDACFQQQQHLGRTGSHGAHQLAIELLTTHRQALGAARRQARAVTQQMHVPEVDAQIGQDPRLQQFVHALCVHERVVHADRAVPQVEQRTEGIAQGGVGFEAGGIVARATGPQSMLAKQARYGQCPPARAVAQSTGSTGQPENSDLSGVIWRDRIGPWRRDRGGGGQVHGGLPERRGHARQCRQLRPPAR
jgi:hypothetical protein